MSQKPPDDLDKTRILSGVQSAGSADFTLITGDLETQRHKQERDLAFAVELVESGLLSQKQLVQAIDDWTIHGDLSLPAHLVAKGLIDEDTRQRVEDRSESRLQVALDRFPDDDAKFTCSPDEPVIRELDRSGRVASALGLSGQLLPGEDRTTREFDSSYQLLRKIGQGGLGVVWLARDEKLKRVVAIKEISRRAAEDSPEFQRFRREAEITGRLEHPSIVPLYQFGRDGETGQPFYAMRYIGKRTLENAIDEYHELRQAGEHDPLRLRYLLNAFVAVCQAIGYAHSRNVVHRDLKPENVALDNYGQVIVLDWGLAKLTGELELTEFSQSALSGDNSGITQTQDGQILGTPLFMAPEQAAGRIDDIDERTDVYGLGAILFAILTGVAPHEKSRESLGASSLASELFRKIVSQPAPPANSLNPEVPPELTAVCAKALALKPFARYQSALELAEDVERWAAGEPVSARSEPWRQKALRWIGKHRIFSQFAAATSTVIVVGAIATGVATQNAYVAEQRASYHNLLAESRELKLAIENRADVLQKNVRFMSNLPPVAALVATLTESGKEDDDPKEVWQERLERVYTGLLDANPNYLTVTFLQFDVGEDAPGSATEIVRVERSRSAGSVVRAVPVTRLATVKDTPAMQAIRALQPGDVYLEETSLESARGSRDRSGDSIVLGGVPVFDDESGQLFGAVIIETNMELGLRQLLTGTVHTARSAYVVNNNHRILLHYDSQGGFQSATRGQESRLLPKPVQEYLAQENAPDDFTDGKSIAVCKIRMNETPDSDWLAFVLMLNDD